MLKDNRKSYTIADGIDWVNGKRVGATRTVRLTDEEAFFDLSMGRISVKGSKPAKKSKTTDDDGQDKAE